MSNLFLVGQLVQYVNRDHFYLKGHRLIQHSRSLWGRSAYQFYNEPFGRQQIKRRTEPQGGEHCRTSSQVSVRTLVKRGEPEWMKR